MKKKIFFLLGVILLVLVIFSLVYIIYKNRPDANEGTVTKNIDQINQMPVVSDGNNNVEERKIPEVVAPLDRASERVTKKRFGMYVTPQNSPVQPEKFTGFHTGVDFEILTDELNKEVNIKAICNGKVLQKEYATGYGGVLVESCVLNNESVTVVYGHLRLDSIDKGIGENLMAGEMLGSLGAAYSQETDGERKHLHLGIHRGSEINILGYVQNQSELANWVDPCLYVCN